MKRTQPGIYALAALLLCSFIANFSFAQSQNTARDTAQHSNISSGDTTIQRRTDEELGRLRAIADSIEQKSAERDALRALMASSSNAQTPENEARLAALRDDIATLQDSFEFLALKDLSTDVFDSADSSEFNWNQELAEVAAPILDSLKSITERPRQISDLRKKIALNREKFAVSEQAALSLDALSAATPDAAAAKNSDALSEKWQRLSIQYENALISSSTQLEKLRQEDNVGWQGIWPAAKGFVLGRGLTLLMAIAAALIAWSIMRLLWWLYNTKLTTKTHRRRSTRYRLLSYSYYLLTTLVVIVSVLMVLYIREDLLLLALSFLLLVGAAISLRSFLPRFFKEARLLLNLGAVREDESIMHAGIPWQVMSLNIQSVLRNPALDGVLRLPLESISDQVSRPIDDPIWFPSEQDDYILLPDNRFAQVIRQTPELVELDVRGGMRMTMPTADFYASNITNISRGDTYGVAITFGLDYALQQDSLTLVPETIKRDLETAFVTAELSENIEGFLVELQNAGSSSLDYLIWVTASSKIASSYYKIQRVVQQSLVRTSNSNGWNIPFPQMTIHQSSATT